MRLRSNLKSRQRGAVAIVVGVGLTLLIGMLAMVIDLGHLYVARTELQNGADAAALAGVAELNGKADGVANAVAKAQQVSNRNFYDFGNTRIFDTGDAETQNDSLEMWVGSSANDSDMVPVASVTSDAAAAGRFFFKVSTGKRDMVAWFASIWNILHVSTGGVAVAGVLEAGISPMAVCAIDTSNPSTVFEYGFLRGVAYNLPALNPISNGDPIWINPVDIPPVCDANHGNTTFMAPFVCTGKVTSLPTIPGKVWVNTGKQAALNDALNSRFGVAAAYSGGHACDPATAPPDTNVKEYVCTRTGGPSPDGCLNNPSAGAPRDWMEPSGNNIPTQQGISINTATRKPLSYPSRPASFSQWGALWSYARELNHTSGVNYNLSDWPVLYGGSAVYETDGGYPGYSAMTPASGVPPYFQPNGSKYFAEPPAAVRSLATAGRRVVNVALVNCDSAPTLGATCNTQLDVVAVGQFFLQRQTNLNNSQIFGEFGGLLSPDELKRKYVLVR